MTQRQFEDDDVADKNVEELRTTVPADLKDDFLELASLHGCTPAEYLRSLIAKHVYTDMRSLLNRLGRVRNGR